ncbi:MAG: SDR family oxidoreductase [Actinomycetota bacterium]
MRSGRLVLVAGATGKLGTEVVLELKRRGESVRALGRSKRKLEALRGIADDLCVADALEPSALPGALDGVDRVFSCLGASVIPMPQYGGKTFTQIDYPANRNLVTAAVSAKVRKFVYVSVFGAHKVSHHDFIRGHELVVEELRKSGLDYSVLRPTGFFSAMDEILLVASRGLLPEFNGGTARTNPIHEADLAELCVDAFNQPFGWEADVGGPDALTRKEIAQLAWDAIGKQSRAVRVPVSVLRAAGLLMRPFYPRVGHLFSFIADILIDDFVAPCHGRHHISDYFRERHAELRATH